MESEPQDASEQEVRATTGPFAAEHGKNLSFVLAGDGLSIAVACGPRLNRETCRANATQIALALNNFSPLCAALRELVGAYGNPSPEALARAAQALAAAKAAHDMRFEKREQRSDSYWSIL